MVTTRSQTAATKPVSSSSPATTSTTRSPLKQRRRRHHHHQQHFIVKPPDLSSTPPHSNKSIIEPLPPRPLQRPASATTYGLIQEHLQDNLYFLIVQSILWNQTSGRSARPILSALLDRYPDAESLAHSTDLAALLRPIGLHNIRAARLVAMAKAWVAAPPCKERRYRKLHYPSRGCGADVKPGEILGEEDEREGWEIAHLPGVGAYALDSFRIFHRDRLRGIVDTDTDTCCDDDDDGGEGVVVEPEWKRVIPTDKDLRAYLIWKWRCEGWIWDPLTGRKRPVEDDLVVGTTEID